MSTYPWKHGAPRTVFITGASSGIGRDMARRLALEGASIAIFNRSAAEDVLAELRAAAKSPGQRFACYPSDVSQAEARLAQGTASQVGYISRQARCPLQPGSPRTSAPPP